METFFRVVGTFGWWVEREFRLDGIMIRPVTVRDADPHDSFFVGVLLLIMLYIEFAHSAEG